MAKIFIILVLVASALQVAVSPSQAQETYASQGDDHRVSPSVAFPRATLEKLANLTQEDNLWLLIPSNVSESQLHESEFSLFKLNTGQLFDQNSGSDNSWTVSTESQVGVDGEQPEVTAGVRSPRSGRKLNLFKNVLGGKPQVSPLYLVNGTVCRFVNSQPICTTLSTTGLFRGQNQGLMQQQGGGSFGLFQGNNNQQQGQLQNNQLQQQQPNQRQVSPPQQQQQLQQNQQGGQFQQFRPMAVLDDEQQAVNVAAGGESNLTSRAQQVHRPIGAQSSVRPVNYAVRRPLNLLSLGRPFRSG